MKELRRLLPVLIYSVALAALVMTLLLLVAFCPRAEAADTFGAGVDTGKSFCAPGTDKGIKLRKHLQDMHDLWGPWCLKYKGSTPYVACLQRIWLESRGHPYGEVVGSPIIEKGLTSVTLEVARDLGGDPCGDPRWSIWASMHRNNSEREAMLTTRKWWADWIGDAPRVEAFMLMGLCGSMNCYKLKQLVQQAGAHETKHPYWNTLSHWREQEKEYAGNKALMKIVGNLKVSKWRVGFKAGRIYNAYAKVYAGFHDPLPDGSPNYCWGDESWYEYPPGPAPKVAYTDSKSYGKACVHGKKARKKKWDPVYSWEPGHEEWKDEQQDAGLLPSDEEYAWAADRLEELGCGFNQLVSFEDWEAWKKRQQKKWAKAKKKKAQK